MLEDVFARLPLRGRALENWRRLADEGELETLAAGLMVGHYDPAYRRSARAEARPKLAEFVLGSLGSADFDAAADQVAGVLAGLDPPACIQEQTLPRGNRT